MIHLKLAEEEKLSSPKDVDKKDDVLSEKIEQLDSVLKSDSSKDDSCVKN